MDTSSVEEDFEMKVQTMNLAMIRWRLNDLETETRASKQR